MCSQIGTSLVVQTVKRLPTIWETWVQSLGREDLLEKEMATHSSILVWKIPWMEEPGSLQSMGSHRIGHNWSTSLSLSLVNNWFFFTNYCYSGNIHQFKIWHTWNIWTDSRKNCLPELAMPYLFSLFFLKGIVLLI